MPTLPGECAVGESAVVGAKRAARLVGPQNDV
jgi:hypothetical protein